MIAVDLFSFVAETHRRETFNRVTRTHQVFHSIEHVISNLKDVENAQWKYLLTGEDNDLELYNTAILKIHPRIKEIRKLPLDNPVQQQIAKNLEFVVTEKLTEFKKTVGLRKEKGLSAAMKVVAKGRKKIVRDLILLLEDEIEEEEEKLLKQELQQQVAAQKVEDIASWSVTCFTIFLFYAITQAAVREIRERRAIQKALAVSNEELETKAVERTSELSQINKELLDSQEQLLKTQQELYKALETERELNHLKSQIITTVSHEYRTPLTIILSGVELLQKYEHKLTEEQKFRQLKGIQTSAKHMTNLVNDMFFLNQAELHQLTCNPSPLNLIQFCQELVEQNSCIASSKISINFDILGTCDDAYLDEELLRPMLINLLSNAIKYSHQGGSVSFTVQCADGIAQFLVQDSGIGIPEADLGHIFEFFYRGSNVGNIGGTGMGLAIVKKCVDLHQGSIGVESCVNQGTTFTVKLTCGRECLN
nr:ATP-binding protein [Scytonema sp. UIC 10036]